MECKETELQTALYISTNVESMYSHTLVATLFYLSVSTFPFLKETEKSWIQTLNCTYVISISVSLFLGYHALKHFILFASKKSCVNLWHNSPVLAHVGKHFTCAKFKCRVFLHYVLYWDISYVKYKVFLGGVCRGTSKINITCHLWVLWALPYVAGINSSVAAFSDESTVVDFHFITLLFCC